MKLKRQRIAMTAVAILAVIGYALLLWRGPWWIDGAHLRSKNLQPADGVVITGFRTMLVAVGAGALAALGLYYTHKSHRQTEMLFEHTREKDREQAELTREGQVTERYVEAIKLLSSGNLTQRLGGIYSLGRIMRDSEKDRRTVIEVLSAFIRDKCPAPDPDEAPQWDEFVWRVDSDIQAAITTLSRRPDPEESGFNIEEVDLRGVNAIHLRLNKCYLKSARLDGMKAVEADFTDATLHDAYLPGADLRGAQLVGANLRFAHLNSANLATANLKGADLSHASLHEARLNNANLSGVDLRKTSGLTVETLRRAILTSETRLPVELAADASIVARIATCEARQQ
ncbi:pentapeptide repeat-containing protein [Streptomyces avermitilis]|uniref:pentapeptide repeat-containing protein n=1 Tax=Streptomyces avermitilis TaxID=33903 RepID=UPI003699D82D